MFEECDACGGSQRWHPQTHIASELISRCFDEELVPIVVALAELGVLVSDGCQDDLQSGRARLDFVHSSDAARALDEIVRVAPDSLARRILETSLPPSIEASEWLVGPVILARYAVPRRVLGLAIRVTFPRADLPTVARCLVSEPDVNDVQTGSQESMEVAQPLAQVTPSTVMQTLVRDVLEIADEEAWELLNVNDLDDQTLAWLVGPAWEADSPGFAPGVRPVRPPFLTWLAIKAAARAMLVFDVDHDEADLDFHLAETEVAFRWCTRALEALTGRTLDDIPGAHDKSGYADPGRERYPRPSYRIRLVARQLEAVAQDPRGLDPREVVPLLIEGLAAAEQHEAELKEMAAAGIYPRGDDRRRADLDDEDDIDVIAHRPIDGLERVDSSAVATIDEDPVPDGVVMRTSQGARVVPVGNLRLLIDAAREACRLPNGVGYACAITSHPSGRPARIAFVRCHDGWELRPARELKPGDRLFEEIDYPYVVSQVLVSDDASQIVVERAGRGWATFGLGELVRCQSPG